MKRPPLPGPCALDRLARRLVDGEHVRAVDADAWHAVAGRLRGEVLRLRLRLERRRDRPVVVVAEEDQGRAHDGGEVGALVERALRGGAVAEVGDRAGVLAAQALAPGEPGRVRDVRRDRDADRRDVVLGGVPPARRMAAPPRQHRRRRHPAQEPDRRLAVAREDPVRALEREHRAGLHRLVVPVDRVRPDAPLTVVDDRALVVGAQQDQVAVEPEQVVLRQAVDLAVGHGLAVADHVSKLVLHARTCAIPAGIYRRRMGAVTEGGERVLAVGRRRLRGRPARVRASSTTTRPTPTCSAWPSFFLVGVPRRAARRAAAPRRARRPRCRRPP